MGPQAGEGLLGELVRRIRADFEPIWPTLRLRFLPYAEWVADDPAAGTTRDGDLVCLTDRGEFPIYLDEGIEVGCARVADQLQDHVMDDLGRPWPTLECGGVSLVPEPGLDAAGKACWIVEERFACPVGLVSALQVFGLIR